MPKFTSARIERIIRTAGAERVSTGAIDLLNDYITDKGYEIAKYAVRIAQHSGRKTVKKVDIELAASK